MPELVWSGKGLGEAQHSAGLSDDAALSYGIWQDEGANRLVFGDNLLALHALEAEFSGKIACIYGDPPYNAKAVTSHYDDDVDHADWLSFMRQRLLSLHRLLQADGSLFLHLDDNELDYMKIVADEIFGRRNFISRITIAARAPSAFSTVNPGLFKASEYVLWYAKDRALFRENPMRIRRMPDRAYNKWLTNPEEPCDAWTFSSVLEAYQASKNRSRSDHPVRVQEYFDRFIVENAHRVCRLASISDTGAGQETVALKYKSLERPGVVHRRQRREYEDIYVLDGQQLVFYSKNVTSLDGEMVATMPLTNIWNDIAWEGIAREGGVSFKKGKKPERLIRRCLELATAPNDWVLDAFSGSGTTGAVAHKMGRRWIMIEEGPQCQTHILPRLQRIVDGADPSGITKEVDWTGGGGFRFQRVE